jgi:hypothetical protein
MTRVLQAVPGADPEGEPRQRVAGQPAEDHTQCREDPGVPHEVHPFEVEVPDDAVGVGGGDPETVDLDHLGDVLGEIGLPCSSERNGWRGHV